MRSHKVVMLVNNDWKIDSRVRREARALVEAGHEVHVVCRAGTDAHHETSEDVQYHTVPAESQARVRHRLAAIASLHRQVLEATRGVPELSNVRWREYPLGAALLLVAIPLLALLAAKRAVERTLGLRQGLPAQRAGGHTGPIGRMVAGATTALAAVRRRLAAPVRAEYLHYLNGFGIDALPLVLLLQPSVVHAHDLTTLSTGYAAARRLGCPLLYDAHELETHTNYWGLAPTTQRWIAIYEGALIRQTRAVVTVCDSIADWLRDHYAIRRPTVVLNSPDLHTAEANPPTTGTLRGRLGLAPEAALAVYVGSVTIDRGLRQCVEAAALVPNLHFAFVGPRYIETEREILATADRLGIRDRIHLVDPVPSREVASFVASANCSVIAIQNVCLSYYFCFPNKLLESVVGGVPVAAARLVELERFLGRFPVGVTMDETDPASIAAAIREVVAHPQRFQPGPAVLQQIRDEYGWPAQAQRLHALYATI